MPVAAVMCVALIRPRYMITNMNGPHLPYKELCNLLFSYSHPHIVPSAHQERHHSHVARHQEKSGVTGSRTLLHVNCRDWLTNLLFDNHSTIWAADTHLKGNTQKRWSLNDLCTPETLCPSYKIYKCCLVTSWTVLLCPVASRWSMFPSQCPQDTTDAFDIFDIIPLLINFTACEGLFLHCFYAS